MARTACKIIINNGLQALSLSIERILIEPQINGGRIPDKDRYEMIQQLADIDTVAMSGGAVDVCLQDIMLRLEGFGVLSSDVWLIYAKPT